MCPDHCLNRRGFIGAGGVALAFAAAPMSWAVSRDSLTPYRAIYDERFDAARAFAAEALDHGWVTKAIRGDVTKVWFRELAPRWRLGPAAITGVTTPQTLFVLERLAWDVGMRVTSREVVTATPVVHWLIRVPRAQDRRS
jgi:hypothetical protein